MAATIGENLSDGEQELLKKIQLLEEDRVKFIEIVRGKIQKLEKELEIKTGENNRLIQRNNELEQNFKDLCSLNPNNKSKGAGKSDDEDLLMRAKELLFEKTKICKKQEMQMEALNNQIVATKDVLDITKDMLNLRNIENDHLQSRLDAMAQRANAEKERTHLTEKKLVICQKKESDLSREYETQRDIFKELRSAYESKIELLNKQLETMKTNQNEAKQE